MNGGNRRSLFLLASFLILASLLVALPLQTGDAVVIQKVRLVPVPVQVWVVERGIASWYGEPFHGRRTASGEIYDKNAWVMATRHLPLGAFAKVRYKGRECVVRVIDRGPYITGRRYDVSEAVARFLGFLEQGLAEIEVAVLRDLPLAGGTAAPIRGGS
jgi:rare lipoprotein A (peptidoglycan hydrolase)